MFGLAGEKQQSAIATSGSAHCGHSKDVRRTVDLTGVIVGSSRELKVETQHLSHGRDTDSWPARTGLPCSRSHFHFSAVA